jgi:Na+/pantothenate symporter
VLSIIVTTVAVAFLVPCLFVLGILGYFAVDEARRRW